MVPVLLTRDLHWEIHPIRILNGNYQAVGYWTWM
jgi:hypothetical protein